MPFYIRKLVDKVVQILEKNFVRASRKRNLIVLEGGDHLEFWWVFNSSTTLESTEIIFWGNEKMVEIFLLEFLRIARWTELCQNFLKSYDHWKLTHVALRLFLFFLPLGWHKQFIHAYFNCVFQGMAGTTGTFAAWKVDPGGSLPAEHVFPFTPVPFWT